MSPHEQEIQELLAGRRPLARVGAGTDSRLIFPGSFNPRHTGHRHMAAWAAQFRRGPVVHEISVENVDKPPLSYEEVQRRLAGFDSTERVVLTRAPRFLDKARLFPGATFLLGIDTLQRLADPRYALQAEQFEEELRELCTLVDQLLVFGRAEEGRFRTLASVNVPSPLAEKCRAVPEAEFREDVSSSQLR